MKKYKTPDEFKAQQARDFATRAKVNAYRNVLSKFTVVKPVITKEPKFIPLADNTPNPHGNIVPPNSPKHKK